MNSQKNSLQKKWNAFTLPEVMVGLLLMVVVYTFAATAWSIYARRAASIFATEREAAEQLVACRLLQTDLNQAFEVWMHGDGKLLHLRRVGYFRDTERISYIFAPRYMLRTRNGVEDTLRPGARLVSTGLLHDTLPLVCSITLEFDLGGREIRNVFRKEYALADIILFPSNYNPIP